MATDSDECKVLDNIQKSDFSEGMGHNLDYRKLEGHQGFQMQAAYFSKDLEGSLLLLWLTLLGKIEPPCFLSSGELVRKHVLI